MRIVRTFLWLGLVAALTASCVDDRPVGSSPDAVPTTPPDTSVRTVSPTATPGTTERSAPPVTRIPEPTTTSRPSPTEAPADPLVDGPRFLALGDSYTIGQSVDVEERWPAQLVGLLRATGFAVSDPEYIAQTGWRTSELVAAIEQAAPKGPFGLVSLQIGVNNQFGGGDVEIFRGEFAALLDGAVELAGGDVSRVIVLSIPDWGATPFAPDLLRGKIAFEIGQFNAVVSEEAEAREVAFVDVTPSSKLAEEDPSLLAVDELHPSGKMYAQWAALALHAAQQALGDRISP